MSELYLDPIQSSDVTPKVDTSVNDPVIKDVEAIVNASVTLGEGRANPADVLGKHDSSPPVNDNPMFGASTEAKIDCV
ncbi:hypothetical protein A2U01_0097377, partial [Trifolium medium]|nr:hypothetical protein [Trifolium medium]